MSNPIKDVESKTMSYKNGLTHNPNTDEKMKTFGNSIEKLTHDTGKEIGSAMGRVSSTVTSYLANTRNYVEKRPVQSLLMAAATGAVLGGIFMIFSRTNKNK